MHERIEFIIQVGLVAVESGYVVHVNKFDIGRYRFQMLLREWTIYRMTIMFSHKLNLDA